MMFIEQSTVLSSSPVTGEEPFLFTDSSGNYNVFVPAVQHGSSGPSWAGGQEAGTSLPLSKFFVANPVFGVWIGGSGGLDSIVNGVGGPVTSANPGKVEPVDVVAYP